LNELINYGRRLISSSNAHKLLLLLLLLLLMLQSALRSVSMRSAGYYDVTREIQPDSDMLLILLSFVESEIRYCCACDDSARQTEHKLYDAKELQV
jgi:hypothetical protein